MESTSTKDNRGGPRPGAGRPKGSLIPDDQKKAAQIAARISTKASERLAQLCEKWSCSKSEAIERLILRSRA